MQNNRNIGFLISTLAFGLAVLVSLPLRVYQYFSILEPVTGFFSRTNASVGILYGVLIASILISVASSLVYRKELGYDRTAKKRTAQGVCAGIAAVSVLFECARSLSGLLTPTQTGTETQAASVILWATLLFGVFAAIYFAVFMLCCFSGSSNASEYKILSVAPIAWFMFRLVYRFMSKISFTKVSELTISMFMLAFMLMFFTAFAQLNSKIDSKGLDWKIVGYGLPAGALALVCFVPRLLVTVLGHADTLYSGAPVEYCDLGLALFTLSVVFGRIGWVGGNADAREEREMKAKEAEKAE